MKRLGIDWEKRSEKRLSIKKQLSTIHKKNFCNSRIERQKKKKTQWQRFYQKHYQTRYMSDK